MIEIGDEVKRIFVGGINGVNIGKVFIVSGVTRDNPSDLFVTLKGKGKIQYRMQYFTIEDSFTDILSKAKEIRRLGDILLKKQ